MNQAVSFGFLFGGGILLTRALTGSSYADILKGHPGTVGTSGHDFGGPITSGVAGVGTAVGNATGANAAAVNAAGASAAGAAAAAAGRYVSPFISAHGVQPGRIDQGQDFNLTPGSAIVAPGASRYLGTVPSWYNGQPYYAFRLLSGPDAGKNYYLAEQVQLASGVAGRVIGEGEKIATYVSSGTGLEIGWAGTGGDWSQTLAQQQGVTNPPTHADTPAGEAFAAFLQSVGV